MGFHQLRRLMSEKCEDCYKQCESSCFKYCYDICYPNSDVTPPSTPLSGSGSHPNTATTKLLIVTFTILAAAFLVVCYYIYYVRFSRNRANARRRSLSLQQPETTETRDEFLDEDHGPIIDHPIWYIHTVGLQPSVINSITVCKYKKGEGLVEGTDCAVCLSEFEEDETLRLLPKCSHAFHIPCIDTWLRSHTNCPMCRAPIVSNTNTVNIEPPSSDQVNTEASTLTEETQVVIMEDDEEQQHQQQQEEADLEMGDVGASEASRVKQEEGESSGVQAMRRSVSLDSLAASQISQAVVNGVREENESRGKGKEASVRIVPRRCVGNQGLLRLMCQSSLGLGRSLQSRPIFMKRSFSCNGKFSLPLCNNNKSRNKNPPLRSF